MSEETCTTLFERIRQRCRQLRWYGPDDENSNWVEERSELVSDPGGWLPVPRSSSASSTLRRRRSNSCPPKQPSAFHCHRSSVCSMPR